MDDQTLQALSKALTLLIFRNGAVENCAASEAILDDVTMKILNKDVNNRFYTVLSILFNGDGEDVKKLEQMLNFLARFFGPDKQSAAFSKIRCIWVTEYTVERKVKRHIGRQTMMLSLFLVLIHQLSQRIYLSKYSESISKRSLRPRTLLQRVPIINIYSSVDSFVPIAESL